MILIAVMFAAAWLAYSNGANDNFKGVATLYGGCVTSYKKALAWATVTTLAGSLLSIVLAAGLIKAFSGGGLVPPSVAGTPTFLLAVGLAGAVTIFLATLLGMPTSTTHALTGALVGVGLVADPAHIQWAMLCDKFAVPLLLSPVLAVGLAILLYSGLHRARLHFRITRQTCVCVGNGAFEPVAVSRDGMPLPLAAGPSVSVGEERQCVERYGGNMVGVNVQSAVDSLHFLSGGAVCFARAVNDTPKIAALMMVGGALAGWKLALIAAAIALGGMLNSRKVAQTMSKKIADLNPGQGLSASLVTSALVLAASLFKLPVSTTHVSVGAIFGIGVANRSAKIQATTQILAAWLTTLPAGLILGAGIYWSLIHPA